MSVQMSSEIPAVIVSAAVIELDGRFLVTRRLTGTHLAGCWEFPGGKCGPDESPEACLRREIREELDTEVIVGPEVFRTRHSYPDRQLELRFFACALAGPPRAVLGQEMRWVPRGELKDMTFPPADRELVDVLRGEQGSDGGNV
jgi:8-oxo-dGTP diphosphatase